MSSAVVITILVAVLLARLVHCKIPPIASQVGGHPSEGSQSAQISSRGQLTREHVFMAGTDGILSGDDVNKDKSYVLIPLKDLMRNRRNSKVGKSSGANEDPLYVMFPFREIMRKTRDEDGKLNEGKTVPNKSEVPILTETKLNGLERRNRRQISLRPQGSFSPGNMSKRRPLTLSVRRGRMSTNDMTVSDYDVHDDSLTSLLATKGNKFSIERQHKKNKPFYLRGQLRPEMLDGLHQKTRVLTEFVDLNPKVHQTVIGKPKKSSSNPINITMFISNLIPPNEVENTRITNSGKLYKSGCLKFSIQLERPACSDNVDDFNDDIKLSTCATVVANKMACAHHGAADDKGKLVEGVSSSPQGSNSMEPVASKMQNSGTAETSGSISDPSSPANHDASSLLLQLIGADQKLLKKPSSTSSQSLLVNNDFIQELQRLFANQGGSMAPGTTMKSMISAVTVAKISPSNSKARAIAEALNLFSKYTALKQA